MKKTKPKSVYQNCICIAFVCCAVACLSVLSYLAGGQQVCVGMQPLDSSRESNSGSVPGTSSA